MPASPGRGVTVGAASRSRRRRPARALGARPGARAAARRRRPPRPRCARPWPPGSMSSSASTSPTALATCSCSWSSSLLSSRPGPAVELDPDGGQHGPGRLEGHGVDVVGQHRDGLPSWPPARRCPAGRRGTPSGRARAGSPRRRWRRGARPRRRPARRATAASGGPSAPWPPRGPVRPPWARRRRPGRRAGRGPPAGPRPAMSRTSAGLRTLWSREIPSSHTGYQIRSAVAAMSLRPLWTSTTSRSL